MTTTTTTMDKNIQDYHKTMLIDGNKNCFILSDCFPNYCDLCLHLESEEIGRQEIATAKIIEGNWS